MKTPRSFFISALVFAGLLAGTLGTTESNQAGGEGPLTASRVQQLIRHHDVKTLEQLLAVLPERSRRHALLRIRSRSEQFASPQTPRVLLFDRDSDLVMAYAGRRQAGRADTLEMIEFDRNSKQFSFASVDFHDSNTQATFDPHPQSCVNCHTRERRPIWDTYPDWPGSFGGFHTDYRDGEFLPFEENVLGDFLREQASNPRYNLLPGLFAAPRRAGLMFVRSPEDESLVRQNLRRYHELNAQFSNWVTTRNDERMMNEIARSPLYPRYRAALIEAGLAGMGNESNADFFRALDPNANPRDLETEFQTLYRDTERHSSLYLSLRDQEQAAILGTPAATRGGRFETLPASLTVNARVRMIVENRMHLSMRNWATTFTRSTYAFSSPFGAGGLQPLTELGRYQEPLPPHAESLSCPAFLGGHGNGQ